jgi:hypothetical protein
VVSLTEGVLSAMQSTKPILAAAVAVLGVGLAGTGTAFVLAQEKGPIPIPVKPEVPPLKPILGPPTKMAGDPLDRTATAFPEIAPVKQIDWNIADRMPKLEATDDVRTHLLKRKLLAAYDELDNARKVFLTGAIGQSEFEGFMANYIAATKAVAAAATELWTNPDDLKPWLEWYVAVTKDTEQIVVERRAGGLARPQNEHMVRRERYEAELALLALLEKPRQR